MSTLNNKLDYLDETKQLIKQAIIDKGQEVSDEDTFRSYVDKISDIETGNNTKDATATSNDILYPETAYISNGKVTGNIMPTYSSNTTLSQTNTISRSLSYSLLDINYNAKIAIVSDEDYKFNFCNIVNNEIDYENSTYITLNDFEEGMDGTYSFSKCCTNFDKNTNDLYLYSLFTFQNTFKVFCYIYNIKTKNSKYIDTYELTIDDANNSLVLNMMIRPNYPNQVIVFCGYTSTTALGSYLTTVFLQFNTVALELQKIEDTISTSSNQYAAKVESCYFTSNGEYLCINVRTGTLSGTTQNGVIYHCVNNFLESIVDSTRYITLFENGNYIAYNQSTKNHCLFNINGDVLYSYSGNLGEVSIEQLTYTNKCILGNYLFGFAYPEDFINPTEPFILYCCKLNKDYTITKEYEIDIGSRTLFNCYNAILYDNKTTRNFDGYLGDTEKEIMSLERNNTVYFSTKDSDVTKNDVLQGKIFYNSAGKQIGDKIFTDYNDSVGILETNSAISVTAVDQLIGVEMLILPDIEYLDKVKVNDIIKVIINIIDVATSSTTLKCNCLVQILEIIDHSDKQFKANVRILAADVNTEDGTATSKDIIEGKTAYVNNERIHGTAKLGTDTSDADATPNDILSPKTAYVDGQKITGNIMPKYENEYDDILEEYTLLLNNISINNIFCVLPNESYIIYIDTTEGFKINACNKNSIITDTKNITDYYGTSSETPYMIKCSNLIGSDDCYNLCLLTRNGRTFINYIFKLNIRTGKFSTSYNRTSGGSSYTTTSQNVAFANTSPDIITWFFDERSPGYIPTYKINNDCSITKVSNIANITNVYWTGAICFSPDDSIVCYNNGHAQDYGCALMSKFIEKYNAQANLKTQYGTYWVILDDSHLIETTKEYSKLYKYSIKDNKLNLTYINDITSMPLVNGKADNDFVQIQNLKSNYFAIHRRPKELYIFRFNGEAETISLAKYINDFDNISINANNIQFTKNGIINIISIAYEKMLYSINIGANTLYNTIGSTVNASHVLDEEIYFDVNGKQIGTMPNNGNLTYTPSENKQSIPAGYTSGGTILPYDITQSQDYQLCLGKVNLILGDSFIQYKQIEYIETSGTQYIDTDIVIDKTMKLIIKYIPILISGGQCLLGGTNTNDHWYAAGYNAHNNCSGGQILGTNITITEDVKTEDVTLTLNDNNTIKYQSDTISVSKNISYNNDNYTLRLFNCKRYNEKGNIRFYSLEIYNQNNELIHNLVPVIDLIADECMLQDTITDKKYTNSGSGKFIQGGIK